MPTRILDADARLRRWAPTRPARTAIAVVFAVSVTMQIVGVPFTSSFGTRARIDLDVYRLGGQIWQHGQQLYGDGSMPFTSDGIWLPFTYPPFAALVFAPLAAMPLGAAGVVISLATVALTVAVIRIVLDALGVGAPVNRWWLSLLIAAGAVWLNPMWMTLGFGQVNIILMAMIIVDLFVLRPHPDRGRVATALSPMRGVLVGLAAAIKLTPLVFIVVFIAARQWRAAVTSSITFVGAALLAWIWLPSDSVKYWTHTLFHTTRIGDPEGRINQNLNALWIRVVGEIGLTTTILWIAASLAVSVLAMAAIRSCRPVSTFTSTAEAAATDDTPETVRDNRINAMLVVCAVAVWGLLVSPTTWAHHWVWSIPIILATATVCVLTEHRACRIAYGALAATGTLIFAIGPFQLLTPVTLAGSEETGVMRGGILEPQPVPASDLRSWSFVEHIIGNAYTLWGIALLVVLWLLPFRRNEHGPKASTARDELTAAPTH